MGWLPLAAAEAPAWLAEVAGLVVGAAVVAYLAFRAGLVPIVGFLLAGILIGPNQLGIIADRDLVDAAAEVGVILLLFTIGLEFSLDRLLRIRRVIFLAGGLQVVLATGLSAAVLDFGFKDGDSRALCGRLNEREIPYVLHSGYQHLGDACRRGIVVEKPASPSEIIDVLDRLLGGHNG